MSRNVKSNECQIHLKNKKNAWCKKNERKAREIIKKVIERVKETREKDERILLDLSSTTLKRIDVKSLERNEGLREENGNIIYLFLREKKKKKEK